MPLQMDGTKLSVKSLIQEFILNLRKIDFISNSNYFFKKNPKEACGM